MKAPGLQPVTFHFGLHLLKCCALIFWPATDSLKTTNLEIKKMDLDNQQQQLHYRNGSGGDGKKSEDGEGYTAAVLEFKPTMAMDSKGFYSQDAQMVMNANLDVYQRQAEIAKNEGADIIVFPEYGITGLNRMNDRTAFHVFAQRMQDSGANQVLCDRNTTLTDDNRNTSLSDDAAMERLSCIAKKNKMYIVANLIEIVPEEAGKPAKRYNTNVAFNRAGRLVAKYHKRHLFEYESEFLDTPPVEYVTFRTEFGTFGMFVCFDMVFEKPAVKLVTEYHVDNIVFSTAWMDVLPQYAAIAFHSGWARGMGVNVLSSNIHWPENRLIGSGIYGANGVKAYTYDITNGKTEILTVAKLRNAESNMTREFTKSSGADSDEAKTFTSELFGDEFTFKQLMSTKGKESVCSPDGLVCCDLEYRRDHTREMFAVGVFSGLHTLEGKYNLELCILLRCPLNTDRATCGQSTHFSNTTFERVRLGGRFTTPYIFPEVLTSADGILGVAKDQWSFDRSAKVIEARPTRPVVSVTLFGRDFTRDKNDTSDSPNGMGTQITGSNNIVIMMMMISVSIVQWLYT